MDQIKLRVVLYESDGVWVAQALEHDVAVFAEHFAQLPPKFERTMVAELVVNRELGREGLDGIPPAPDRFVRMYEAARWRLSADPATRPGPVEVDMRVSEAA
jgi:hypothetical protein